MHFVAFGLMSAFRQANKVRKFGLRGTSSQPSLVLVCSFLSSGWNDDTHKLLTWTWRVQPRRLRHMSGSDAGLTATYSACFGVIVTIASKHTL